MLYSGSDIVMFDVTFQSNYYLKKKTIALDACNILQYIEIMYSSLSFLLSIIILSLMTMNYLAYCNFTLKKRRHTNHISLFNRRQYKVITQVEKCFSSAFCIKSSTHKISFFQLCTVKQISFQGEAVYTSVYISRLTHIHVK